MLKFQIIINMVFKGKICGERNLQTSMILLPCSMIVKTQSLSKDGALKYLLSEAARKLAPINSQDNRFCPSGGSLVLCEVHQQKV